MNLENICHTAAKTTALAAIKYNRVPFSGNKCPPQSNYEDRKRAVDCQAVRVIEFH